MGIPQIDYNRLASKADIRMLLDHGWEVSEDHHEARLYSEGWSSVQAAVFSTQSWIEENREDKTPLKRKDGTAIR